MKLHLNLTYTAGHYHGAEWPPSPGRLFQALVAASYRGAYALHEPARRDAALSWLETQPPPLIRAPELSQSLDHIVNYVPNNDNKLDHVRAEKSMTHYAMPSPVVVSYEWNVKPEDMPTAADVAAMAGLITYVGRTVDSIMAHGLTLGDDKANSLDDRPLWQAKVHPAGRWLLPAVGFLHHLNVRFPKSASAEQPDFSNSQRCDYSTQIDHTRISMACFSIHLLGNQKPYAFPPWAVRSVSGMLRGAMIAWADQPTTRIAFAPDRLAQLIHGHQSAEKSKPINGPHFGVLPLPSQTQGFKADGWLRKVCLVGWGIADTNDETLFQAMAQALNNSILMDQGQPRYLLKHLPTDVADPLHVLTPKPAKEWRSLTPVVLPSMQRKGRKPEAGLQRALLQRGFQSDQIESIAAFTGPMLPKTLAAADYNIARDSYLGRYPRCHAEILFREPQVINGPLVIGAGRHLGFGLFIPVDRAS